MMMNGFLWCGMVDRRKLFSLISSRNHCQRSSPSRICGTPRKSDIENNNMQMENSLPANVNMAATIQICCILLVLIKYSRYIEIFKSWIHNFKSIESFLCSFLDSRNRLVDLIYGWPSLFPSSSSATSFLLKFYSIFSSSISGSPGFSMSWKNES